MKKTLNINIAGQLFRVDEDAFEILTRYLEHVSARFQTEAGGEETVADIEARIAEIFGGGNEPPTLISKEMVKDMINIMGAPEDYYEEISLKNGSGTYRRKAMYDPNTFSARVGKGLSEFFKAFGRMMSAIWRVLAIILGTAFSILGFTMLFTFVLLLFFHDAPLLSNVIEPEITNIHTLLSIVLNTDMVIPVLILAGIVVLLPLAGLTYLGIKMIFNIKERSKVFGLVMFLTWLAAACALAVILTLQLVVYADDKHIEERIMLDTPPDTFSIVAGKRLSEIEYDKFASADKLNFFLNSSSESLYGSIDLHIFRSDTTTGYISVERRASSNNSSEARERARQVEYNFDYKSGTLILDEYYSLPEGEKWYGSMIDVDISLPEGTIVKIPDSSVLSASIYRHYKPGRNVVFRVEKWGLEELEKQ